MLELLLDVEDDARALEFVDGVLTVVDRLVTPEVVRVPLGLYALLLTVVEAEFLFTLLLLDVLYFDVVILLCELTELRLLKLLLLAPLLTLLEA